MGVWCCMGCDYEYDDEVGSSATGVEPGTSFDSLPEDWRCPLCGLGKAHFMGQDELESDEIIDLAEADDQDIEL
uniref:Rubredoxin n=1 Tax=Magnetococcus massalia (strain MO-1) TaxID=451514 RepID=A0A1S7LL29_MAGMO|nr:Rubredoxin [Candidatus Magnetococcus massalia]